MVGWSFNLLCKIKSTAESERPISRSMTASPPMIIQLIRFCNFQNHRFGVTSTDKVDSGIGARKRMLALVRAGNQGYASIVANPGLLQLYELRHLHIRGVQRF